MNEANLKKGLFSLRLGVFAVMFVWALDKFIQPGHAAKIFEKFYSISGVSNTASYAVGVFLTILTLLFLFGLFKKFSYGAILVLHGITTIGSWKQYINPWEQGTLLFYTAIPMLSACYFLYLFREEDTLFTIKLKK